MITGISFHVKYYEIDQMGIVHHANYLKWFETGRRDYLRKAGIPNSSMNTLGFYLPLSEMELRFKNPARYGDEITLFTNITCMSCAKVKFEYKVFRKPDGKLLASGKTFHAWTDRDIKPLNIEKAAPQIYASLKAFTEAAGILVDK